MSRGCDGFEMQVRIDEVDKQVQRLTSLVESLQLTLQAGDMNLDGATSRAHVEIPIRTQLDWPPNTSSFPCIYRLLFRALGRRCSGIYLAVTVNHPTDRTDQMGFELTTRCPELISNTGPLPLGSDALLTAP